MLCELLRLLHTVGGERRVRRDSRRRGYGGGVVALVVSGPVAAELET
jgi:hypothetical protein